MTYHYDYIVIGSGFGGSVSALRLAEKGYRVCVFERGKRFQPDDYPTTNWHLWKWLWAPGLLCRGIQCLTFLKNALILSGAGVGGGSLGYCGVLLEPPDAFFRDPQWAGLEDDWRVALAPFYEKARQMLGVTKSPHLYQGDEMLKAYARDIGREAHFRHTDVGIFFGDPDREVPDPYFGGKGPPRTGCNEQGCCMVGCRAGGKNSLDRNYLYLAERLGVNIVPEREVVRVEPSEEGYAVYTRRSTALVWKDTRVTRARGVVFSAGALGTNQLLLKMREDGHLPHLSREVGRKMRSNSEILLGVSSKKRDARYCDGASITCMLSVDDHTVIEAVRYPEGSDAMSWLGVLLTDGGSRVTRPLKFLWNCIRQPVSFLRTLIPFGWAKRSIILLVMQVHDNRFDVELKERRFWPFSRKMDTTTGSSTIPTHIPAANEAAKALAEKIDGIPQNAVTEVLFNKPLSAHILGGCVIGTDEHHGVVDKHCRVFGYENMYVLDGSSVPANPGVNPSLSITALAEYAMSFVAEKEE